MGLVCPLLVFKTRSTRGKLFRYIRYVVYVYLNCSRVRGRKHFMSNMHRELVSDGLHHLSTGVLQQHAGLSLDSFTVVRFSRNLHTVIFQEGIEATSGSNSQWVNKWTQVQRPKVWDVSLYVVIYDVTYYTQIFSN